MSTQGQRLKKIRTNLSLTQEQFGAALGISKQFYSNIETDKTALNNDKLAVLLDKYNVDLNYLIGGIGTPFREGKNQDLGERLLAEFKELLKQNDLIK